MMNKMLRLFFCLFSVIVNVQYVMGGVEVGDSSSGDEPNSTNSPPVPADSTGLDLSPLPPGERSEPEPEPSDDTDTSTSDSTITPDACTEAMTSVCQLNEPYTFEKSLRCLENHMSELQGECSVALNVMMTNLFTECGDAVSTLCPPPSTSTSTDSTSDESVYVLTCLTTHQAELSTECQTQLDTYLHEEYPCTKEAALFCSDTSLSPEDTLSCLEAIAATSPEEVSLECAAVLDGFSACKDGPAEEGGRGGRERDNGKPGPKPKPRARARMLGAVSVASEDMVASADRGERGEDRWERDDKDKPKPKPKPAPGSEGEGGGQHRCWVGREGDRIGRDEGGEGGGFLGGAYDELYGSGSGSDSAGDDAHSTGIVVGSLLVALGLVAVVGVKYRQSQEEVDSKGGYWRAPSIQAMLFDDSAHEDDRLNTHTMSDESSSAGGGGGGGGGGRGVPLGRVVEMGDMSMDKSACSGSGSGYTTTTATAIPVTLSPIPSDEIRV